MSLAEMEALRGVNIVVIRVLVSKVRLHFLVLWAGLAQNCIGVVSLVCGWRLSVFVDCLVADIVAIFLNKSLFNNTELFLMRLFSDM